MKTIFLLSAFLAVANVTRSAQILSIEPAHALPDYTKLKLATNANSAFSNFIQTLGLGDFNEDGRLDVAVTVAPGHAGVSIQLQGVDGSLTRSAEYAFPPRPVQPAPVWDYVIEDFNEDGHLDIIASATGNDLMMFRGHGDGTFDAPYMMGLAAPGFPVAADLNGDGHLDLVAGTLSGTVGVFGGAGNGTFTNQTTLNTAISAYHPRRGQIMVSDLNRDGNLDVAIAAAVNNEGDGNLDVYLGNGQGGFGGVIRTFSVAVWKGALGDFNGDGIVDFAGDRTSPSRMEVWLGKGDGRFTRAAIYPLSFYRSDVVQAADLNNDGILDLAVSGEAAENVFIAPVSLFRGHGDGTFQPGQEFTPLGDAYIFNSGPRFCDFNGDGRLDIVSQALFWTTTPTNRFGPYVFAVALNLNVQKNFTNGLLLKVAETNTAGPTNAVVLDVTSDFLTWTPIATNRPVLEWRIVDTKSASAPRRFYRTRRE